MTHRSRSGGPQRGKPKKAKGHQRKLHHPPPPPSEEPEAPAPNPLLAPPEASESDSDDADSAVLPARVFRDTPSNQTVLNALDKAIRYDEHFGEHVQRAKALLFERRWLDLFLDRELLDAYTGRWVPSRALLFRAIMAEIRQVRALFSPAGPEAGSVAGSDAGEAEGAEGKQENGAKENGVEEKEQRTPRILSIGGGAGSELLAIAALCVPRSAAVEWTGVDIGDWGSVIERIVEAVGDWELRARFTFLEADVLKLPPSTLTNTPSPAAPDSTTTPADAAPALPAWLGLQPDLTTVFFTLNELLSQSRPKTINLLRHLTSTTPAGKHLLIVDSASDIAEFALGSGERTWPAYMIVDAMLMGVAVPKGSWRRVRATDSKWFRLEGEEKWGRSKLENARYWLRMYERV